MGWAPVTDPNEIAAARSQLGGKGGAAQSTVMGDRARLELQSSGLPVLRTIADPFSRMRDPKQQGMARTQMMTAGQKQLTKEGEGLGSITEDIRNIDEFQALNKKFTTGDWGTAIGNALPGFLGGNVVAPDAKRMDQIALGLARGQRKAGEGTISDYDAKMFTRMVGGPNQAPQNNEAFANAYRAVKQAALDKQSFREAFLQANGTLIGADRMWQQYGNANRLFDKNGNVQQRKGWADYFGSRAQARLKGGAKQTGGVKFLGYEDK